MKLSKLTKPELEEIFRNANFTEEEEKVFKMLSCGKTITETAQKINVCDRTVNRISKKVYEKINRLEVKMVRVTQDGKDVDIEDVSLPKEIIEIIASICC